MEALADSHLRAVADYVGRAAVPIIARGGRSPGDWVTRGTGAWIRVPQDNGTTRLFLATAAHVVFADASHLIQDLYVPVTRPAVDLSAETVRLRDIGLATYSDPNGGRSAETERMDTALIEIRNREIVNRVLGSGWAVVDIARFGPHAASAGCEGTVYLIAGYPSVASASGQHWTANALVHLLTTTHNGEVSFVDGFAPDLDLLLERPNRTLDSETPLPPFALQGVSGALVWALRGGVVEGVWNPGRGAVIAGHQVRATPTGYIRARRSAALARLLQQAAPEIASEIDGRLSGRIAP
jgi:hypothetical protein